jgi:hypothetical protein
MKSSGVFGWLGRVALFALFAAPLVGPGAAHADLPPPPGVTRPAPVPEAELASIRKVDDTHYELGRALFQRIVKQPDSVGVRVTPSIKAAKRIGYALFGIRQWQTAEKLGLQNGDVVTAVNGVSLADAKPADVAAKVGGAAHVTLQLQRKGQPLTLEYDIKG